MKKAGDFIGKQVSLHKANAKAGEMLQKAKKIAKDAKYGFIDKLKGTKEKTLKNINRSIADNARNADSIKSTIRRGLKDAKAIKDYINK